MSSQIIDEYDRFTLKAMQAHYLSTPGASHREACVTFARELKLIDRLLHVESADAGSPVATDAPAPRVTRTTVGMQLLDLASQHVAAGDVDKAIACVDAHLRLSQG
jgi:hypothetical protein